MITGDWVGGNAATVSGVTLLASPAYNFFGGANTVSNVKVLSPWFYSTDGFQGVSHVDNSFIFNGDNAFAPGAAGVQNDNLTITSCFAGTTENSVFTGGYYGFEAKKGYSALVDDIDVKTYLGDSGDLRYSHPSSRYTSTTATRAPAIRIRRTGTFGWRAMS